MSTPARHTVGTAAGPDHANDPLHGEALRRARRAVVAASLGNALEWFDIIVYAFFAVVISKKFFEGAQGGNDYVALLLTFGTFALSYLVRPLGAMVIGNFGDKHGRKAALTLTIALMAVGVAGMAFTPSYATIGIAAPLLILLARLVQGFSAGGEFGSATAFLTENAEHRKAYYASWQVATQGISMFLAAGFGWALTTLLSKEALYSWGFRVPFVFGLLIAPVGWYIRSQMDDTPEFAGSETVASPLGTTFVHHMGRVFSAAACVGVATMSIYLITYLPTMAQKQLGMPPWSGYVGAVIAGVVILVASPLVGHLADRVGSVGVMLPTAVVGALLAWPLFRLLTGHPSLLVLTVVEVVIGLLAAFYFAPLPALMSAMFPVEIRTTGMSLAYNIGVTLMGGLAPVFLTWLVTNHGLLSPSWYYIVIAAISVAGLLSARKVFGQR